MTYILKYKNKTLKYEVSLPSFMERRVMLSLDFISAYQLKDMLIGKVKKREQCCVFHRCVETDGVTTLQMIPLL